MYMLIPPSYENFWEWADREGFFHYFGFWGNGERLTRGGNLKLICWEHFAYFNGNLTVRIVFGRLIMGILPE